MSNTLIKQFFAYIQMQGEEIIPFGRLQSIFKITSKQERDLLSKLAKQGSIIRLKRGIYLVPLKIPPGGKWQPDSLYLISQFMKNITTNYYIGGLYAFNYYGLTSQIPNQITIYNDRLSGKKKLGTLYVQLIKTSFFQPGGSSTLTIKNNYKIKIASLTQSIVNAFNDWKKHNTLPSAFSWIEKYLKDISFLKDLVCAVTKHGNIATKRRIGYFIYKQTQNSQLVQPILKTLKASKGWIALNPQAGRKGSTNKIWRIIDNINENKYDQLS